MSAGQCRPGSPRRGGGGGALVVEPTEDATRAALETGAGALGDALDPVSGCVSPHAHMTASDAIQTSAGVDGDTRAA
jgi:hypothetical protein